MWCALLVVLASGCSKTPASLAGGKPVGYWIEALGGQDAKLRKTAVAKLGNVGSADPAAFPAVVKALNDADASVRCEAILALLKFGDQAQEAEAALTALHQRDRDAKVRDYAAKVLEKLHGPANAHP